MDSKESECPICQKTFPEDSIEDHVNRCIFLNSRDETTNTNKADTKRNVSAAGRSPTNIKKPRLEKPYLRIINGNKKADLEDMKTIELSDDNSDIEQVPGPSTSSSSHSTFPSRGKTVSHSKDSTVEKSIPLAEKMRPNSLENYVGQTHMTGTNTILRKVLDKNEIPSMILWGPPGCGKTTLAHIIAAQCKKAQNCRFVKLSATMSGVNDVKEAVKVAKNEQRFNRKTILFMDEIHRFNKLQQDIFLPHVENGSITLIGATTENPSFSLNSALLSRCRVIILEKLEPKYIYQILERSLKEFDAIIFDKDVEPPPFDELDFIPKVIVEKVSLTWLSEMCDGDARIALNSLQLAMQSILESDKCETKNNLKFVSLDAIKDGIKKSHLLYDRKGDQHYDIISALHKSIRASDDNAALYWCTRMIESGEDPRYICRRMIRAASEDIGLADPQAVSVALSALNAVQFVGMPESDVIIAQCAIYLARAPKSTEALRAMERCKRDIKEWQGPLPSVPLHLRNAPTKLMKNLGYGKGYNMMHKDDSGLHYMPEGMEDRVYFD